MFVKSRTAAQAMKLSATPSARGGGSLAEAECRVSGMMNGTVTTIRG